MIVSCVPIEKHSTVDPYRHEISGPGRNAIQYTIIACFPPLALRFLALDGGDDRDLFLKLSDLEYYSVTTVKKLYHKNKKFEYLVLAGENTRLLLPCLRPLPFRKPKSARTSPIRAGERDLLGEL